MEKKLRLTTTSEWKIFVAISNKRTTLLTEKWLIDIDFLSLTAFRKEFSFVCIINQFVKIFVNALSTTLGFLSFKNWKNNYSIFLRTLQSELTLGKKSEKTVFDCYSVEFLCDFFSFKRSFSFETKPPPPCQKSWK